MATASCRATKRWNLRGVDWSTIGRDQRGQLDASDLAEWIVDLVEKELKPILTPEKCLGLLEGNHERTMRINFYTDLTRRLCKRYDLPYLGQTALIRWIFRRSTKTGVPIHIFAEHGATGGGTDGNSIKRHGQAPDSVGCGTYFSRAMFTSAPFFVRLALPGGTKRLVTRRHILALTGTYLKGYEEGGLTYSETEGLST